MFSELSNQTLHDIFLALSVACLVAAGSIALGWAVAALFSRKRR